MFRKNPIMTDSKDTANLKCAVLNESQQGVFLHKFIIGGVESESQSNTYYTLHL